MRGNFTIGRNCIEYDEIKDRFFYCHYDVYIALRENEGAFEKFEKLIFLKGLEIDRDYMKRIEEEQREIEQHNKLLAQARQSGKTQQNFYTTWTTSWTTRNYRIYIKSMKDINNIIEVAKMFIPPGVTYKTNLNGAKLHKIKVQLKHDAKLEMRKKANRRKRKDVKKLLTI